MRSLLTFLSFRTQSVRQASALLALTTLLSNVLGLLRNLVFLRVVHSPALLDTYYASFKISDLLFNLVIFGAMGSALVPVLSELIATKHEGEAHELTNELLSWSTILFTSLAILIALFMPFLVNRMVGGFDPWQKILTIRLSRLMLLQTLALSTSFIFGSLLNGYKRFAGYAFAPLLYNLSLIIGGVLFPHFGIMGIACSAVIGAILHAFVQFREVRQTTFRIRPSLKFSPRLTDIAYLMIPRSIAQAAPQLVFILYTYLASLLPHGSLSAFSNMNDLQTTPTAIIGASLASAVFPTIAANLSTGKQKETDVLLAKAVRTALFLLIPTAAICLILRAQIVRLYFGIGGYSWPLTYLAILTFAIFIIGIIPASLTTLFSRVYYAQKDTRTPMAIALVGATISALIAYLGVHTYHQPVWVLALAEVIGSYIQCGLFWFILLKRNLLHLPYASIFKRSTVYVAGSFLLAAGCWDALQIINIFYNAIHYSGTTTIVGLFIQTSIAAIVGVSLYFGYSTLRSNEELQWIRKGRFSPNQ